MFVASLICSLPTFTHWDSMTESEPPPRYDAAVVRTGHTSRLREFTA
jgi:hypothetical protein